MDTLWCFTLLSIFFYVNGLTVIAGNNRAIRFHGIQTGNKYIVEENQPLSLYFTDFVVTHGWCYNYYGHDPILDTTMPATVNSSCIHFEKVTKFMSTLWECTIAVDHTAVGRITLKRKQKIYHFTLNIHVRAAKRAQMIINNRHIEFSYNNTSSYYDGFANYIFEEHENIHAICLNMEKEGKVQLISAKAGATSQAVFDSASVIINLHMGLNNSYLDCEYISVEPDDKYIYRVYFITKYKKDGTSKSLAAIIGCIVGPVLLIASVGLSYWFKRLRRPNDAETPYNGLREENQETPLPESMYDSCFSENFSTMQPNNDILKCSDFSESCYHSYAKVNYLQCKPKLPEGQQRSTIIYNVPYDHSRRKH